MDSPSPVLIGEVTSTSSPYFCDTSSPHPIEDADILYDPHSSEEELEVINNITLLRPQQSLPCDLPSSTTMQCTKRKWSQVSEDELEDEVRTSRSSLSSDEEVTGLFSITSSDVIDSVPLQFRTSPPVNALRLLTSPPIKSLSISPRKKSRPSVPRSTANHHIQRPCLDFEKMQQVSVSLSFSLPLSLSLPFITNL